MTNITSKTVPQDRQSRLLSIGFGRTTETVYHIMTTSYYLPGLVHLENFILTFNFSAICKLV